MIKIRNWDIIGLLLLVTVVLSLYSCAKQGVLTGGPKDMRPPRLDTALSTKNFQTNFFPESVRLYFDEWIQLKNPSQILISPPTQKRPEITYKGKYVDVIFDEEEILRDSTTYAINFGSAISDFTEANPFKNFRFVFSTGDKIDSLIFKARVIDSYTEEVVEDVVVMLYDQDRDSIVYEEQPYYFATTDKKGECTIQNIRPGNFKCVALKDENFNFLFDQETEQIGFVDSLISIKDDSIVRAAIIKLFLEEVSLKIDEAELLKRGKIRLRTNKAVEDLELLYSNTKFLHKEVLTDSVFYWYKPDTTGSDSILIVNDLEGLADTLILKSKRNTPSMGEMLHRSFRYRNINVNPGSPVEIQFNQIINSIDSGLITFQTLVPQRNTPVDTTAEQVIDSLPKGIPLPFRSNIDTSDLRTLLLHADMQENQAYEIILYPGAVKGFFDNQNDTLISTAQKIAREELGNIFCKFDSLDASKHYVVLLKQKKEVIDLATIAKKDSAMVEFLLVKPGSYYLDVIIDENANGKWDPGNYLEKRQSEQKLEIQLEELRKNWDIETEIKWNSP